MEETKGVRSTEGHKHRTLKEPRGVAFGIRKGFRERRQKTTWNSWPGSMQRHVGMERAEAGWAGRYQVMKGLAKQANK